MLRSVVAPLILLSVFSYSKELNNEKFQLLAKNIDTKNSTVIANGDVVVFSKSYYITADKIIYDKEKETFELFNNVLILKDNNIQTQSDYAFLDINDDTYNQTPVLLMEKQSNLWINSKSSKKNKTEIELEDSIISSCDCIDPVWSIKVSSASFDTEDKWLHAYNTRLYIKDVPVFYTPYLGFPTDKTRRSGLLIPTIGYSKNDGGFYSQPIYFAPAKNYDIELIPQIRTKRGSGLYAYYRLADSPYSLLKLKTGYFEEKDEYRKKFDLKNEKHYGWSIDYERTKLFSEKNSHQDGLYASINWLNDIEYKTVEDEENIISTEKKVESKLNYFYNTPEYYGGLYARYYIDTDLDSNDTTLQELPQVQLHSYNKDLGLKNLIYSIDAKAINYERQKGLNATIYEMSLPISYTKYFLDDFLYINLENKSVISRYQYSNSNATSFDDGTLVQNESSITLGTDLIKPYKDYLHTINLSAKYSYPKNMQKDGDLYNITVEKGDSKYNALEPFPIVQGKKNIKLQLNQSLYSKNNFKQIINHKVSQSILYDESDNAKFMDLENFVKYNYSYGTITNKIIYNVEDKHFTENTSSFTYNYENFKLSLGYYKSKETLNSNKEELESYRIKTSYDISNDYRISYYENYNLKDEVRNKQGIGFDIFDRCWALGLKFEKEVVPSTSTNTEGINQNILYLNLELKPLGGIKQKYNFKDRNES
ncbi:LPS-assembly protein LptD [Malaciobacter sp. WC5094]